MYIEPLQDGTFQLEIVDHERSMYSTLCSDLARQMGEHNYNEAPQASMQRLFPPAHPHDPEAQAAYREIVGDSLAKSRKRDFQMIVDTIYGDLLTREQLEAWLRAFNSARLLLGTLLDLDEEPSIVELSDQVKFARQVLYDNIADIIKLILAAFSFFDSSACELHGNS